MVEISDYTAIDHFLQKYLFRTALDPHKLSNGQVGLPLTTLREFTMQRVMNLITDRPSWHTKVFDTSVVSEWKEEFFNEKDFDVTKAMMEWCVEELRCKASVFEESGFVTVYDGGIIKSDSVNKDWEPDTDKRVLNLVDPSLFPFVYEESRVLRGSTTSLDDCIHQCGKGEVLIVVFTSYRLVDERVISNYSSRFQWLPCEVDISGDGARITSYINNLHPQNHKNLYTVIEQIIGCTIPLWNCTLSALENVDSQNRRIVYTDIEYDSDNEDPCQYLQPEPPVFNQNVLANVNGIDLRSYGKSLQVIIKLANIHLTPDKPEYGEELWHVEGQMNEHICASAIYYYDSENITASVAFRQQSAYDDDYMYYDAEDHEWLSTIFGCHPYGSTVQDVGSINITQGRLITFPNVFQHRMEKFQLQDPTKPGYCKLLSLFLVDPHINIFSTVNVPCQRIDWWQEVVTETVPQIRRLPREIQDHIFQFISEFPMTMSDAMELKLELMDERENSTADVDEAFHSLTFDLS
ncbi:hypothetical protein APHAL10511_005130 [Amanita phalloides]|nr:hypothetical protein APHAL10511_005130 [Amanita phalloides]